MVGRLCVGRFRWAESRELSGQELEDLTRELVGFLKQIAQASPPKSALGENSNVVLNARKSGFPCRGLVVVDSPVSEEWRKNVRTVLDELAATLPDDCEVDLVDLAELYDLYLLRLDTYDLPIPEKVKLKIVGAPATVVGIPGRAVTLQIPLSEIPNLVHDHQLSLFSKNLRVPISGSKYNRKIQEVLSDPSERQNFWFFNNGITAICHEFGFEPPAPDSPKLVVAKQLQIVNGCQTSMTVYNEGLRLLDQIQSIKPLEEATVLLRLIELPSEDILRAALAQRIARYTNSQTPITGRDLHATDPIQAKFREEMNRDWRIFFETKKQEWRRRTEQNKTLKQNFQWPHVVRNDDAAQYVPLSLVSAARIREEPQERDFRG